MANTRSTTAALERETAHLYWGGAESARVTQDRSTVSQPESQIASTCSSRIRTKLVRLRLASKDSLGLAEPESPTHRRQNSLQDILAHHANVFNEDLGLVKQTAQIHKDPEAKLRFYKPRTFPYAFRVKVEQELDRLEKASIIERTQFSDWAAPDVPVLKREGTVRICGDYKVTVNQAAKLDTYPLPCIEDLFASLNGGKMFTKLDLAHAYQQVPLDEESKKLMAINTHKGLYQNHRLPFGVSSALSIFQRIMENILRDIHHVCVYLDDILVTGGTEAEHVSTLNEVLGRLS